MKEGVKAKWCQPYNTSKQRVVTFRHEIRCILTGGPTWPIKQKR